MTDNDPLRFFVTNEGEVIINPKIINKTRHPVLSNEGCLSFNTLKDKEVNVKRSRVITVKYKKLLASDDTPDTAFVSNEMEKRCQNLEAFIFQHEIDHMDGIYIYDKD